MARATGNNKALIEQMGGNNQPTQVQSNDPAKNIHGLLKQMAPGIQAALPKYFNADRMIRVTMNSIRLNPKLLECEPMSLIAAVMQSAQLGLEPGPLGHAWLIPYWDSKANRLLVQFQIGYKGMLDLVRRSGEVQNIMASEVYEKDQFEVEYGSNARLIHKPYFDGDRGKVRLYYAHAKLKDGGESFLVMSVHDMTKYRDRYTKSKNREGKVTGPWVSEFDAMAKKTVLKQLMKYMPLSIELQAQLHQDESVKNEVSEDMTLIPTIEIEGEATFEEAVNQEQEGNQSAQTQESGSEDGQQEMAL